MPRLNGKFVSQETYDAAMTAQTREENNMSDETTTTEETGTVDKRFGARPTTVLKKALNAAVNAEVKVLKAQAKVDAYETKGQALRDALDDAQVELNNARDAVEAAQEALTA